MVFCAAQMICPVMWSWSYLDMVPLRIIDAQNRVLEYPTSLCRYKLALLAICQNVHLFVYLKILLDFAFPLNKNLKNVSKRILSHINIYHFYSSLLPDVKSAGAAYNSWRWTEYVILT